MYLLCVSMGVDVVEFNQMEEIEDDYILEDFFPKALPYPLQPLIYTYILIHERYTMYSN